MLVSMMPEGISRNWKLISNCIEDAIPPIHGESPNLMNNILMASMMSQISRTRMVPEIPVSSQSDLAMKPLSPSTAAQPVMQIMNTIGMSVYRVFLPLRTR